MPNRRTRTNKDERTRRKNQKRFRSRLSTRQQRGAALTVSLLALIVLVSMIITPTNNNNDNNGNSSVQSTYAATAMDEQDTIVSKSAFIDTPKAQKDYGSCEVRKGKVPDHPIQSTFTASYPGSGAKMTWKLIEAMTGLVTGDDFQLNGHTNIVSIKTHYPSSEGRQINAENIPRAMLLIRNPLHSIPSYFNFVYEYENNLPGHSTKAPLEEWIKWRNNSFDRQVQVWRRHTEYWMDAYDKMHRMVISYEKLIDDDLGPAEAMKIAEFLNRSDGVSTVAPEEVPCVWHAVIKYKKSGRRLSDEGESQGKTGFFSNYEYAAPEHHSTKQVSSLRGKTSTASNYNNEQKETQLPAETSITTQDKQPVPLETSNRYTTPEKQPKNEVPQQGGTGFFSNYDYRQKAPQPSAETYSAGKFQESVSTQNNQHTTFQEPEKNKVQIDVPSKNTLPDYPQTNVQPSLEINSSLENRESASPRTENYAALQSTNSSPEGQNASTSNYQKLHYPKKEGSPSMGMSSTTPQPNESAPSETIPSAELQQNSQKFSSSSNATAQYQTTEIQLSKGTNGAVKTQLPRGSQFTASNYLQRTDFKHNEGEMPINVINEKRTRGSQYLTTEILEDGDHLQEKKDEIQSKRGGPKYIAPFNPQQLRDLIGVLTQLLERYRDDKDLAPILVSFIDEAARRAEGPLEDENTIVIET